MKNAQVIDRKRLGRRLRAWREDSDFTSMVELANAIEDKWGIQVTAPRLYTYEEGRTLPPLDVLLVLIATLQPYDGLAALNVAVRSDISAAVFGSP